MFTYMAPLSNPSAVTDPPQGYKPNMSKMTANLPTRELMVVVMELEKSDPNLCKCLPVDFSSKTCPCYI